MPLKWKQMLLLETDQRWRAGCGESRQSGSVGGMRKRTVNTQRTRKAVHWDLPVELRRQRASSLPDETEAGQRHVHLSLAGLLSHLPRKNAEEIATLVDVERLVLQALVMFQIYTLLRSMIC
jgi:cytochrome c-type biogenesis protein CcmH/NrfG